MFRTVMARLAAWRAARRQRRVERLTAQAASLEDGKAYDLLFLHEKGFVRARGTGQSITRIYGEMAVQAGVWALTDNYSGDDVQNHLVVQDQYGNRRQAVSDAHVAEARAILRRLGIRSRL